MSPIDSHTYNLDLPLVRQQRGRDGKVQEDLWGAGGHQQLCQPSEEVGGRRVHSEDWRENLQRALLESGLSPSALCPGPFQSGKSFTSSKFSKLQFALAGEGRHQPSSGGDMASTAQQCSGTRR